MFSLKITIQRGLPEFDFQVEWITSTQSSSIIGNQSGPNAIVNLNARNGHCLLRIMWIPKWRLNSKKTIGGNGLESSMSIHHLIQFRVNSSYPLQAVVIGNLLQPDLPAQRFHRSKVSS